MLLSSVGRRVELTQAFRRAAAALDLDLTLVGTDMSTLAPAMHHVDAAELVPPNRAEGFVDALHGIVVKHRIDLLIPTIDTELPKLSEGRDRFAASGCTVVISDPRTIGLCFDKMQTYRHLVAQGIDVPQTWLAEEFQAMADPPFPCFIKPRTGSAGKGGGKANDPDELAFFLRHAPEPIVQEFLPGVEHTQDVYCGFDGRIRCIVPRRRIEIRLSEVQKAVIVKDSRLVDICRRTVETLDGRRGVLNVQCIVGPDGRVSVLEINPRFGGGSPLAIFAGADFPRWLMAEWLGQSLQIGQDSFEDGVTMTRYDQSVFIRKSAP